MNGDTVQSVMPPVLTELDRISSAIAPQDGRALLVSRSLPWPATALVDFLGLGAGAPRVYWESGETSTGFAGFGVALALTAAGPNRFRDVQASVRRLSDSAIWEAVNAPPAAGPHLFGGFAFQPEHAPAGIWAAFPAACFILPRYQLTRVEGRNWLTVNQIVEELQTANGDLRTPNGRPRNGRPANTISPSGLRRPQPATHNLQLSIVNCQLSIVNSMPAARWRHVVNDAVRRIRHGDLDKVVLARTCDVRMDRDVDPTKVLARLERRYPGCYRFLIEPAPGHAFFGATPELLVEVNGMTLNTVAMAGSVPRGDSAAADAAFAREIMTSLKERQEHAFVVDAIETSLRPLVTELDVPEQPALRRLRNIQHLQTVIRGRLADGAGVLEAVEALHPTPAVGGVPRLPALQMIADEEPVPRGWYASPVGWMDLQGNGVFGVAIRSAVSVGAQARLYAGAGIVADSDAEREWEETELKFRPMLEALGEISGQWSVVGG
ncbi:MAG: isochorismate synthase MenF [Anaerolineae bacterium]